MKDVISIQRLQKITEIGNLYFYVEMNCYIHIKSLIRWCLIKQFFSLNENLLFFILITF